MKQHRRLALASVFVLTAACGGAPPPPSNAAGGETDTSAPAKTPAAGRDADAPPLEQVAVPSPVFAVGRLRNPEKLMDAAQASSPVPFKWREKLEEEAEGVLQIVNLQAPAEVVIAMDEGGPMREPEFLGAVSLPLRSLAGTLEFARRMGERPKRFRPGMYRVGDDCVIARSLGPSPARLVCGDDIEHVETLVDYATRGLPTEELGNHDLVLEVRAQPFRDRYGSQLSRAKRFGLPFIMSELESGFQPFDDALREVVSVLLDEGVALADDIDKLRLSADLNAQTRDSEIALALDMRGTKSWTAQTLKDAGGRQISAPPLFWRLPAAANRASWSIGGTTERFEPIHKALIRLADTGMGAAQVPALAKQRLLVLVEKLWVSTGNVVYATGGVPAAALPKPAQPPPDSFVDDPTRERELVRAGIGWHLMGFEEDSKRLIAWFDELARTVNDPTLRRLAEKELGSMKDVPTVRTRPVAGLVGARGFEVVVPSKAFEPSWVPDGEPKPKPAAPLPVILVVVPDGSVTWVGFSADEKTLVKQIQIARAGKPADTLASRSGLAPMRSERVAAGGFITLGSVLDAGSAGLVGLVAGGGGDPDLRKKLPGRGEVPVLFGTQIADAAGPTLTWSWDVPGAFYDDVGALAVELMGMFGGLFGSAMPPLPVPVPVPPVPPAPTP